MGVIYTEKGPFTEELGCVKKIMTGIWREKTVVLELLLVFLAV